MRGAPVDDGRGLDTLSPAEEVAFVLHDLFALSFEDMARSWGPVAGTTRRDSSRRAARGRRGRREPETAKKATTSQRDVAEAFMIASRDGNLDALLTVLDPDVVLRVDAVAVRAAAARSKRVARRLLDRR